MNPARQTKRVLADYRRGLEGVLGEVLDSIILYGSQARGDVESDSDIDVLCIMKGSFHYGELIAQTSELTASFSLEHDVVLSRAFVSREDFESGQSPFLTNVRREGVPV